MSIYMDGPITYYTEKRDLNIDSCIITREDEIGERARQHAKNKEDLVRVAQRSEELKKQIDEELRADILKQYQSAKDPVEKARILMFVVNLEKNGVNLFAAEEVKQMKDGLNGVIDNKETSI